MEMAQAQECVGPSPYLLGAQRVNNEKFHCDPIIDFKITRRKVTREGIESPLTLSKSREQRYSLFS